MPPKKKMDAVEKRTRSDEESDGMLVESYQIVTSTMVKQLAGGVTIVSSVIERVPPAPTVELLPVWPEFPPRLDGPASLPLAATGAHLHCKT
jgi:hypothetical protein